MNNAFLIDTHVLLWYATAPEQLSHAVRFKLQQRATAVFVSAISALEIAIKFRLGKLPQAEGLISRYQVRLGHYGFDEIPLDSSVALGVVSLPTDHRDPFDRVIAAQALSRDLPLITRDAAFSAIPDLATFW